MSVLETSLPEHELRLALLRNRALRSAGKIALKLATPFVIKSVARRQSNAVSNIERLRRRYGIEDKTPIREWDDALQERLDESTAGISGTRFAVTSGTTSTPKRIPYSRHRLRIVRRTSFEAVVQAAKTLNIDFPSLFVLGHPSKNQTLSDLLLPGDRPTGLLEGFTMPSRYIGHAAFLDVRENYGDDAERLVLMAVSNPSILYATNPSTIARFLQVLSAQWSQMRSLLKATAENPSCLGPGSGRVLGRGLCQNDFC